MLQSLKPGEQCRKRKTCIGTKGHEGRCLPLWKWPAVVLLAVLSDLVGPR